MHRSNNSKRTTRVGVVLAVLSAIAAVLAGAPPAVAQGQEEPAADEIVIDLDFVGREGAVLFDDVTFEARCDGNDEPIQRVIAVDELTLTGKGRFVLVKDPAVTTCSVELLEVPPTWALHLPEQNPVVGVSVGSVVEWQLEAVPAGRGLLRIEVHAQVGFGAFLTSSGLIPAFVSYRCSGGDVVHTRVYPGFSIPSLGDILDSLADGTEIPNMGLLLKTVVVPQGVCAVWTTTRPGSGVYLSGGAAVAVNEGELKTVALAARYAPGVDFLCQGLPATIVGTEGDDVIRGTSGADVIYADSGDDLVFGGGGADIICGGPGKDQLWGNAGKDTLLGGTGNDIVRGGRGRDVVSGGAGNDVADGGIHDDTCQGEFVRRCEAG